MTLTAFLISVLLGAFFTEWTDFAPWIAVRLVRRAVRCRYSDPIRAATRVEELEAVLNDRPGKLLKVVTATGFLVAATIASMRERAQRLITSPDIKSLERFRKILIAIFPGVTIFVIVSNVRLIGQAEDLRQRLGLIGVVVSVTVASTFILIVEIGYARRKSRIDASEEHRDERK